MGFFDWLFGGRHRQAQQPDLDAELADWRIVEIEGADGDVVVARIRIRRPQLVDLDRYTSAVSISWPIDDNGMTPELTAAMTQFEISLEEFEDFSYLVQVRTGLGERNWLYYTSDGGRFTAEIRSRLGTHRAPELTIEVREDPNWAEWRILAERIGSTTVRH